MCKCGRFRTSTENELQDTNTQQDTIHKNVCVKVTCEENTHIQEYAK